MRQITMVRLDDVRKAKGYTSLKKLSEASGISRRTLENWEAGALDRAPFYRVFALAEFLEVDIKELFVFE